MYFLSQYPDHAKHLSLILPHLFIALNNDLNTLEELKNDWVSSVDEVAAEIVAFEIVLSQRYIFLMKLFADNFYLERECALTVFSLNPCPQNFYTLLKFVEKVWSPKNNGQHRSTAMALYGVNGSVLCKSLGYDMLQMPFSDVKGLPLDCSLCDDLLTVIMSPRNKLLTWSVDTWAEFSEKCQMFLKDCNYKRNFVARNLWDQWKLARVNEAILLERVKLRAIDQLKSAKEKNKSIALSEDCFSDRDISR